MLNFRRRQARLLDRYWAALRRDAAATPPAELDAATASFTADLARRVPTRDATRAFNSELRARLEAQAAQQSRAWTSPALQPNAHRPTVPVPPASVSSASATQREQTRMSHTSNTPLDLPVAPRHWRRDVLALIAAVLALALIGSILALVLHDDTRNQQPAAPIPTPPTALASPSVAVVAPSPTLPPPTATTAVATTPTAVALMATPSLPSAGEVVATIDVGANPAALASGAGALWVANSADSSVSRIDPETNQVVATIAVGTASGAAQSSPTGLALVADQVWVLDDADASIVRIGPATNQVVDTLPIPGVEPFDFRGIAGGFGSIWLTDASYSVLLRVDPVARTVATIEVGAFGITVSDDAIWVADYLGNTAARIDPATNTVVATVKVGFGPSQIAVDASGVWVTNQYDESISRIDPATNHVVATIEHVPAHGIAAGAGGVWVGGASAGGVYRIDPATNQIVASLSGGRIGGIATSDGALWLADYDANTVLRINPAP
jgi:YVTN family beta-propeller protein